MNKQTRIIIFVPTVAEKMKGYKRFARKLQNIFVHSAQKNLSKLSNKAI